MATSQSLVVAGGFGIDTNVYPLGDRIGSEMTFARVTDGLGQAGCYSALAAAAMGVPTRALAALGDDRLGAWVRDELHTRGVEVMTLHDPLGTHRSVNVVAADGTRRNHFDPRGAGLVAVDTAACRRALRGAAVLHCHLDDWCRQLLPLARAEDLVISCDLQDVVDLDDPYRADWVATADVIFMSGANLDDPGSAAVELARRRAGRIVVVGQGARGCLVATGDLVRHHAPASLPEAVVDTNGAGDNLAVGFLVASLFDGLGLDRAVRRAQLAARWICAQPGDAKAPLTRPQLDALELAHGAPAAPA